MSMGSGGTPEGNSAKADHQPPEDLGQSQAKRARREVDDGADASSAKTRIRVTRACDECRRRKDRCDGQRPSCRPCLAAHRTCTYNPSKKRGLRTGYVRSLEILVGFLFETVDGLESWISGVLNGEAVTPSLHLRPPAEKVDDVAEFATSAWRRSNVLKMLESVLSSSESQEDEDQSHESFEGRLARALYEMPHPRDTPNAAGSNSLDSFPISPMDTDSTSPAVARTASSNGGPMPRPVSHTTTLVASAPAYCDELDLTSQELRNTDEPKLPANWSFLLDLYFDNTHCWLPISLRHDLLRTVYTFANSGKPTAPSPSSEGDQAFLWATLTYTSQQNDVIERIRGKTPVNPGMTQTLHRTAVRLAAPESGGYELGHVRAFLLLTLFEIFQGSWNKAWVMIGQAAYISSSLDLMGSGMQATSTTEIGVRRTVMACIALETLIASRIHTRPYFRRSDIQRIGLLLTDGIEEWEPWQPRLHGGQQMLSLGGSYHQGPGHVLSIFVQFVNIMGLFNDLLTGQVPEINQTLHEVEQSLQQWGQMVSMFDGHTSGLQIPPHVLNLQFAFGCVEQFISSQKISPCDLQFNQSTMDRWNRMRLLSNTTKGRIHCVEAIWIPPTLPIYSCLFRESLETCRNNFGNGGIEECRRMCHDSLSEMEQLWWSSKNASTLHFSTEQTQTLPAEYGQQPPQTPHSFMQRMEMRIASLTPVSSDRSVRNQQMGLQPEIHPMPNTTTNTAIQASQTTNETLMDVQQVRSTVSAERAQIASGLRAPKEARMEEFTDDLIGPVGDEELFDSLAILDPIDWVANPPDFMRHLGAPRDASADMQSFFDADPT